MIDVDLSQFEKLKRDIERFAHKSIPHAVRNSLNASAFEGRREWLQQIDRTMVLRNTFTTRSVRVEKARGLDTRRMVAVLGSVAPYMDEQEHGATIAKRGKHGKPIPTSVSAGQAEGTKPRTKLVRRANWLSAIQLRDRVTGSAQQRNAAAIRMAAKSGSKFVFLDLGRRKGIFRVEGGRKRLRVRMVWDLSRPAIIVPRNPTLQTTLTAIEPKLPRIHEQALIEQARRHRILGY